MFRRDRAETPLDPLDLTDPRLDPLERTPGQVGVDGPTANLVGRTGPPYGPPGSPLPVRIDSVIPRRFSARSNGL